MNHKLPKVTIVIPVKPGLEPIALSAVKRLNYPKELLEVYLVYGKNPSMQRNRVVSIAQGEIIYFLDNDSLPAEDTLMKLVNHLMADDNVSIAGGPSIKPDKLPLLPFVFGKTFESLFCTGSSRSRYLKTGEVRETTEKEVILCNMVMKKKDFLFYGGLNERLYPNEENELMEKVRVSGKKIIYDPSAYIIRTPRQTLKAFIKQVFNYGRGRGEQTVYYPKSFNFTNFVPLFFLIYLIFSLFKGGYFLYPIYVYFLILLIDSVMKAIKDKDLRILVLPFTSFLLHIIYGIGTIYGILRAPFKKIREGEIRIEKIPVS
ncbi:MAG: glycosyltransferase [Proteobacteria bacterium]|nr:glycosyltransferase [Pseudomonadota bacterium]